MNPATNPAVTPPAPASVRNHSLLVFGEPRGARPGTGPLRLPLRCDTHEGPYIHGREEYQIGTTGTTGAGRAVEDAIAAMELWIENPADRVLAGALVSAVWAARRAAQRPPEDAWPGYCTLCPHVADDGADDGPDGPRGPSGRRMAALVAAERVQGGGALLRGEVSWASAGPAGRAAGALERGLVAAGLRVERRYVGRRLTVSVRCGQCK
jgi:hypothetical protein